MNYNNSIPINQLLPMYIVIIYVYYVRHITFYFISNVHNILNIKIYNVICMMKFVIIILLSIYNLCIRLYEYRIEIYSL